MPHDNRIEIAKSDLQAAWIVLENLAVSLDQIGGVFGRRGSEANGTGSQRSQEEALTLAAYLTPGLVQAINEARVRLGQYLPDAEAEALTNQIPYWDYAAAPGVPSQASP
jgi:hypothetical protein